MLKLIIILSTSILLSSESKDEIKIISNGKAQINQSQKAFTSIDTSDSLIVIDNLFRDQIDEGKVLLSESIISDITGDTISALYNFKLLFESLAQIDEMNDMDEFEELEYNKLLTSAVEYYEKKALTVNKIEFAKAMKELS